MKYETMSIDEMNKISSNNPDIFNDSEFRDEYLRKSQQQELCELEVKAERKMLLFCQTRAAALGITLQEYISMKLLMQSEMYVEPYLEKAEPYEKKLSTELEYIRELLKLIYKAL